MIIPTTPVNANIVKKQEPVSNDTIAVMIHRVRRNGDKKVYDLKADCLCELVDKLSRNKIAEYAGCSVIKELDAISVSLGSLNLFAEYLYNRLTKEQLHQLFGEIEFNSSNDLKNFFSQCSFYRGNDFLRTLSEYIYKKYTVLEGKISRKLSA